MTTSNQHRDYLGVGEKYPASVDTYGRIALVDDAALVKQAIGRILNTPVGSEFMCRSFGSHLRDLAFEPNTTVLQSLLEYFVRQAIDLWEPRVRFTSIDFKAPAPERLDCTINYVLVATGTPDTFVYPFNRENRF